MIFKNIFTFRYIKISFFFYILMYLHISNYLYILGKLQQDKFWDSHLSANITNNSKVHSTKMTQKVIYPHTQIVVKTLKIGKELLEKLIWCCQSEKSPSPNCPLPLKHQLKFSQVIRGRPAQYCLIDLNCFYK